ncbi:MAG: glycosyltransferase family 2 protein [Flavobacteriaceae bacterium]|nr:glycosyltransferase family 2 protein [Flavobacteriaceae bacterium]
MRLGKHPEKNNTRLSIDSYHRVIIPVYIPNLSEDYFKHGLQIFKYCIKSLLHTIHDKTRISLIDNGCCTEVVSYLSELYENEFAVDQLLHSKKNLGKVNAIYSAIKSNLEPLLTISDADVFFLSNWQPEVEKLISEFPQAGMVSPVPSSKAYGSPYASSTLYYGLLKNKISAQKVMNPGAMQHFERSIGRKMYESVHLEKYLCIGRSEQKAVIGSGHFVVTMRAEVFSNAPETVCTEKIVGGSENRYIDQPNNDGGFLRISTIDNYAYHMGNVAQEWMEVELNKLLVSTPANTVLAQLPPARPLKRWQVFLGKVIRRVLFGYFKIPFLKSKGLNRSY